MNLLSCRKKVLRLNKGKRTGNAMKIHFQAIFKLKLQDYISIGSVPCALHCCLVLGRYAEELDDLEAEEEAVGGVARQEEPLRRRLVLLQKVCTHLRGGESAKK